MWLCYFKNNYICLTFFISILFLGSLLLITPFLGHLSMAVKSTFKPCASHSTLYSRTGKIKPQCKCSWALTPWDGNTSPVTILIAQWYVCLLWTKNLQNRSCVPLCPVQLLTNWWSLITIVASEYLSNLSFMWFHFSSETVLMTVCSHVLPLNFHSTKILLIYIAEVYFNLLSLSFYIQACGYPFGS